VSHRKPAVTKRGGCDETICVVDRFLSPAECSALLAISETGIWVASAVAPTGDGSPFSGSGRNSQSMMMPASSEAMADLFGTIEARLAERFAMDARRLEPWQITRYRRGEHFDYHLDCGAFASHPSGERVRTVLIVLEKPLRGGATHFRALDRKISPRAGRLIVWRNLLPSGACNHAMIHAGRPVRQGRKTILTTWERRRPYSGADKGG
jgi:2OG-Fe(II) oxygenase superfamily